MINPTNMKNHINHPNIKNGENLTDMKNCINCANMEIYLKLNAILSKINHPNLINFYVL